VCDRPNCRTPVCLPLGTRGTRGRGPTYVALKEVV
jgi:hypothetical protein